VAATGHHQWTGAAAALTKKLILYVCVCVSVCLLLPVSFIRVFFNVHVWVIIFSFTFTKNFRRAVILTADRPYNITLISIIILHLLPVSV
jgi:hypothetical protein